ncbi:MAG TPA: hypothetical protein VKW06_07465 [Candidatus Angelobacter sp.]|nr:hypothetical protein [Candidatus Angelobacter sp.]
MKALRVRIVALLFGGSFLFAMPQPGGWTIPMENLGLNRFDRVPTTQWIGQQGITFIGGDRLLVYQVGRTSGQAKLGPRAPGGGAGNFLLIIKVLTPDDGRVIKTLALVTNANISQVLATRDGRFLVRSGFVLTLYSENYEPLVSRELKLEKQTDVEDWKIRVSPSGDQIVLLHEQVFSSPEILADGSVLHDGKARVDVEVLDAATLQPSKTFTLEHTMPFWSPAEGFLVSSNPAHSYSDQQVGLLTFDGKWSPMRTDFKLPKSSCGYTASAMDRQLIVVHGCETFTVLSLQGKRVFSRKDGRFAFTSARARGQYVALQCDHHRTGFTLPSHTSELTTDVDRIQVFDTEKRMLVLEYRLQHPRVYYAISSRGELGVADGPALSLARPER